MYYASFILLRFEKEHEILLQNTQQQQKNNLNDKVSEKKTMSFKAIYFHENP